MSKTYIPQQMRGAVVARANRACEYCLISEDDTLLPHEVDHIIAEAHGGQTVLDNLAWSCFDCNHYKGSNIASIDIETGQLTWLFNPRVDAWGEHFSLRGARIVGLTDVGRVTVRLLGVNMDARIQYRVILAEIGSYP